MVPYFGFHYDGEHPLAILPPSLGANQHESYQQGSGTLLFIGALQQEISRKEERGKGFIPCFAWRGYLHLTESLDQWCFQDVNSIELSPLWGFGNHLLIRSLWFKDGA